jgi:uroporphyrinogen decarboxylase
LPLESSLGATALSVDWRVPLDEVHRVTGDGTVLQGNLDPAALLGTPESLESAAREVLSRVPSGAGHIFNLGHGVLPETDPQQVKRLVDLVHAASRE